MDFAKHLLNFHCFTHAKISFCNRKLGAEMTASTLEIESPFQTQNLLFAKLISFH